ncbi:tetratricopeptide repeat protein [Novosphingobium huizhouense]|uniref:tetratricopeptide repeat protein n=1 Tax=Novosphingobium huizhouense TaxID=2866625 RepID=UPI001CD899A2|nr:tetratricopeptide repeat protein [Novosphingobium huizhouense]
MSPSPEHLLTIARAAARRADTGAASDALAQVLERFPANRRARDELAALFGIAPPPAPPPPAAFALLERLWNEGRIELLLRQIHLLRLLWPADPALAAAQADALVAQARLAIEDGAAEAALAALDLAEAGLAVAGEADAGALANTRAVALVHLGRHAEAEAAAARACALAPDDPAAHANRAGALRELDRLAESRAEWSRALELAPETPALLDGLATTLLCEGRFDEAVATARRALAGAPGTPELHNHLGAALQQAGALAEARAAFDAALALRPQFPTALFNLGTLDLLEGDFARGWPRHEWRADNLGADGPRTPPFRIGPELAGQRIRVDFEQGLGDTLQFAPHARALTRHGAAVTLVVQPPLVALLRPALPDLVVTTPDQATGPFDAQVSLLSLPYLCHLAGEAVPSEPWLRAEPARVAAWRERLAPAPFRVGICWQGSTGRIDAGRSFPLAAAAPLARVPGVALVSLHKGTGLAQLDRLPAGMVVDVPAEPFDAPGEAFLDTAAVMQACDLVVTSDTSVAHLAGGLGVPTWAMLRHTPDWRWGAQGEDCRWYPAMRLLRQSREGDWDGLFAQAAPRLAALVGARGAA